MKKNLDFFTAYTPTGAMNPFHQRWQSLTNSNQAIATEIREAARRCGQPEQSCWETLLGDVITDDDIRTEWFPLQSELRYCIEQWPEGRLFVPVSEADAEGTGSRLFGALLRDVVERAFEMAAGEQTIERLVRPHMIERLNPDDRCRDALRVLCTSPVDIALYPQSDGEIGWIELKSVVLKCCPEIEQQP